MQYSKPPMPRTNAATLADLVGTLNVLRVVFENATALAAVASTGSSSSVAATILSSISVRTYAPTARDGGPPGFPTSAQQIYPRFFSRPVATATVRFATKPTELLRRRQISRRGRSGSQAVVSSSVDQLRNAIITYIPPVSHLVELACCPITAV